MSDKLDDLAQSNEAAWNRAAEKYAPDVERDVEFLGSGGVSLAEPEIRLLGDLSGCHRAIHLQCSHGLDTLSLLNLGAAEVVGVDRSAAMLALAREKSDRLNARAHWIHADVLEVPTTFDGTAALVYTGKGALPWVFDLDAWAGVIVRLLRPEGRLYIYEGHPLNSVWERGASGHRLSSDGRSYFDAEPRANASFPASAVQRFTPLEETPPTAWERQWTIGQIVTALCGAGLRIEILQEHPEHYWPEFSDLDRDEERRLPHAFSVVACADGTTRGTT